MRKVVAGAVAAAALAWASDARADDTKKGSVQQPGSQSAATAPGKETGTTGTDSTSRNMRSDTRADQTAASADAKHPVFDGKKNYDMDGKVKSASGDSITIERKDGLPPATLHVGSGTKVQVDGKHASAANLSPGQDVKASFNMSGDKAEAVEIKADKHEAKDRQELSDQTRENQKKQAEQTKDQQQKQK
jgi:colicin import membrane protein